MSEGAKGGEFFTPTPIVKLIVDVIEPFHGRIFDPACGSGGMFVQSARSSSGTVPILTPKSAQLRAKTFDTFLFECSALLAKIGES